MVFAIRGAFLAYIGSIQLPMVFTGVLAGLRDILARALGVGWSMFVARERTTSQINTIIMWLRH
jgi:hypothetical protein